MSINFLPTQNEEWSAIKSESQGMTCFSSGEVSYCIPERLVSFIGREAEKQGKQEALQELQKEYEKYDWGVYDPFTILVKKIEDLNL